MKKSVLAALVLGASLAVTGCFDKQDSAQKIEATKDAAMSKVEEIKNVAADMKDSAAEKMADVKDAAASKLDVAKDAMQSIKDSVTEKATDAVDAVKDSVK